ncbi:hypothetical protein D3Y57_04700 (plasmid) [Sphingomonas paeninsulae]|uniref:Uncharacterized protein n=1 Tax=Sphingomonas paeninsulae TaxID=2319844 RepID=A0A494T7H2_SPHPE|nr:hypothetical protein [Sphingomonas paeninsulae]AYJ85319.1 hypothetical protein D3Y57_04700 [Sphingomonas paeninsulae]
MATQPEAGKMFLIPPPKDKCQECATDHPIELPHNAQSLFYQVHYKMSTGEEPSWLTAMAHCDDDMKALWTAEALAIPKDPAK